MAEFPDTRLRRLRELPAMRSLVRETRLSTSSFVYPLFITHGSGIKEPIEPMPGCYHISLDLLAEEIQEISDLGIPSVLVSWNITNKRKGCGRLRSVRSRRDHSGSYQIN